MNEGKLRILVYTVVVLFGILFSYSPLYSRLMGTTGIIEGTVRDKETGEVLPYVNIIVVGTKLGGSTDMKGYFQINNVPSGIHKLRFTMIGYKPLTVENVRVAQNLRTVLDNVRLVPTVLQGEEIVVQAERPLIEKDITGTTRIVENIDIDRLPIDTFEDVIKLQAGVTGDGHIRGGRSTEVLYLLDGLPIQQVTSGGTATDVPKSAISEMTIQTGGFDAEFGNALSGVVNIITRSGTDRHESQLRVDADDLFGGTEHSKMKEAEFFAAGPLKKGSINYLISSNFNYSGTRWWQDFQNFFSGPYQTKFNLVTKLDIRPSANTRIGVQYIKSYKYNKYYDFRWRFNLTGLPPKFKDSDRISISLSQFITKNVFFNINLGRYFIHSRVNDISKSLFLSPEYQNDPFQYDFFLQYVVGGKRLWWGNSKEYIYTLRFDLTNQVTERHFFKTGIELQYFDIYSDLIKNEPQLTYFGKPLLDRPLLNFSSTYNYYPRAGAFYIEDKFKLTDGGVLNIGLRYDILDPRASRPAIENIPTDSLDFRQNELQWVKAKVKQQISPRFGIAMPITEKIFIFTNFGLFFQMPLFEYLYTGLDINLRSKQRLLVGNPDLKPERTKAWEFSYRQILNSEMTFSITYYSKETSNLIDTNTFLATDSKGQDKTFAQFVNSPYARAQGLEFVLERRPTNIISGKIAYTYSVAKALSETTNDGLNYAMWGFPVNKEQLYYLSWDQRHTLNVNLKLNFPSNFQFLPLRDSNLNLVVRYNSPRPYTYYPSENREGFIPANPNIRFVPNNRRMESNLFVDVKFGKYFRFSSISILFYCDVRNILDRKNLLWVSSDGQPGGELRDPSAWAIGRRTRVGLRIEL